MKKIILSALVAVASLTASAQVYLGGTVGFQSSKAFDGADNVSKFTILPEIGYMFNEKWGVGLGIGYTTTNGTWDATTGYSSSATKFAKSNGVFILSPYARFVFAKTGIASFFLDGGFGVGFMNNSRGNIWQVGIKPGVKLSASEKVDFVAQLGMLGYSWCSEKAGKGNLFGIGVDNTTIKFGVYYNF